MIDPERRATQREALAEVRSAALQKLFSAPGYYDELRRAIACNDPEWMRAIVKKQFAQLHAPEDRDNFLRGYWQLFRDIAAEDPWYAERAPSLSRRATKTVADGSVQRGRNAPDVETLKLGRLTHTVHRELTCLKEELRSGDYTTDLGAADTDGRQKLINREYERLKRKHRSFNTFAAIDRQPERKREVMVDLLEARQFVALALKLTADLTGKPRSQVEEARYQYGLSRKSKTPKIPKTAQPK